MDRSKKRNGKWMRNALAFTAMTLFLASCASPSKLIPSPASTRTPTPSNTAKPAPSLTLTPSTTPEPTLSLGPSPSASASTIPSQTPAGADALDCALLMQSLKNGNHYQPRDEFSISWKVRNTGTAGWDSGAVDFIYIAGTKMYQYPLVQLKGTVSPGNVAYLIADMRAPRNPGRYSTTWSLRQGDKYFCYVSLAIYVD